MAEYVTSKSGLKVKASSAAGQRVIAKQGSSSSSSSSSSKSSSSSSSSGKGILKIGSDGAARYADGSTNDKVQAYLDWNYGRDGGNSDYRNANGSDAYQREYDRLLSGGSYGTGYDMMSEYQRALREAESASAQAYRRQIEAGVEQINAQRDPLKQQYTNAAQQAYIAREQAKKNLPEALAAQGLTGGVTESSNLALETGYGNSLNTLTRDYNNNLAGLDSDIAQLRASGDIQIAQNAAQYQQMMAQAALAARQQQAQLEAQMQLARYNNDLAMQRDAAQSALSATNKSSTAGGSVSKPRLTAAQASSAIGDGLYSDEIEKAYQYYYGTSPNVQLDSEKSDQLSRWWSANSKDTFNSLVNGEMAAGRLTQAELAEWMRQRGMR